MTESVAVYNQVATPTPKGAYATVLISDTSFGLKGWTTMPIHYR